MFEHCSLLGRSLLWTRRDTHWSVTVESLVNLRSTAALSVQRFKPLHKAVFSLCLWGALLCNAPGCANHPDQLARAELHFQGNRFRSALSGLEDLEQHRGTMSVGERVRYDVARGMCHLRLDQRLYARYWLSLAREEAQAEPTALTRSMREEIDRVITLTDSLVQLPAR